jgi:glutathione S-transferase
LQVDFEDKQYAVGPGPEFDRSQWTDVKPTLGLDYPNLPYLIDEDFKLTESMAIMKYIAAKWRPELLGANPL